LFDALKPMSTGCRDEVKLFFLSGVMASHYDQQNPKNNTHGIAEEFKPNK
jgi:hypothetical protein